MEIDGDRQPDRQTDRQTDRQLDREIGMGILWSGTSLFY